jgi:hypothetical protein
MRTIEVSQLFKSEASKIAEQKEIDGAISAILWALKNNAEDYPVIQGFKTLRMAKTDAIRNVPELHVVFKILGDKVRLEYIETGETDEFRGPPIL